MPQYQESLVVCGRTADQSGTDDITYTIRFARPAPTPGPGMSPLPPMSIYSITTTDAALYAAFPYDQVTTLTLTPST